MRNLKLAHVIIVLALAALMLTQLACGGGGGGSKVALIGGVVRDASANPLVGGDTTIFLVANGSRVAHTGVGGVFSQQQVTSSIQEIPILGIDASGNVYFKRLMKGTDFMDLQTGSVENNLGNIDLVRQTTLSTGYQAFLSENWSTAAGSFSTIATNATADPVLRAFAYTMLGFAEMYEDGDGAGATARFDSAIAIFDLAMARCGRGGAQLVLGGGGGSSAALNQAIADLEQVLIYDPEFSFMKGFIQRNDVRGSIALARFLNGETNQARQFAETILAENANMRGDTKDLLQEVLLHISLGG